MLLIDRAIPPTLCLITITKSYGRSRRQMRICSFLAVVLGLSVVVRPRAPRWVVLCRCLYTKINLEHNYIYKVIPTSESIMLTCVAFVFRFEAEYYEQNVLIYNTFHGHNHVLRFAASLCTDCAGQRPMIVMYFMTNPSNIRWMKIVIVWLDPYSLPLYQSPCQKKDESGILTMRQSMT